MTPIELRDSIAKPATPPSVTVRINWMSALSQ
jgi:hypothetical protein